MWMFKEYFQKSSRFFSGILFLCFVGTTTVRAQVLDTSLLASLSEAGQYQGVSGLSRMYLVSGHYAGEEQAVRLWLALARSEAELGRHIESEAAITFAEHLLQNPAVFPNKQKKDKIYSVVQLIRYDITKLRQASE